MDLNLLITFAVVAEEKSITAAAERLLLSQPAVSRALQRARAMFSDPLLVRSTTGFEPTPQGRKILDQLSTLLPAMDALVSPSVFDPRREPSSFRLSGADNVCSVLVPRLLRRYGTGRSRASFEFLPWQTGAVELLEHGQLDLALHIDDGLLPAHMRSERLYHEEWFCAVSRESRHPRALTLTEYLAADHIAVSTLPGVQNIPDKQMAALGHQRRSSLRMPYFGVALACLPGTEAVLTLTSGMREIVERNPTLRVVDAPAELRGFDFLMVWHPRLDGDARHRWLRSAMRRIAKEDSPADM